MLLIAVVLTDIKEGSSPTCFSLSCTTLNCFVYSPLGGIVSSSFILFFTCIGIPIYVVYSVCDSASEFGAMGSTSFWGFSYPNLLLVFLNLLFLGTCIICFSQVLDFLWVFFILFYFSVPYFGLACDHGNSFLCLEE